MFLFPLFHHFSIFQKKNHHFSNKIILFLLFCYFLFLHHINHIHIIIFLF
jgi:hypothetical protein